MQGIKFGTDGVRGIVNKSVTPRVAFDLGRSLALFLLQISNKPKVIIGKDTRTSCDMLENGLCVGLNYFGVDCIKVGEISTPGLAFLTKKNKLDAGVMVTASHNKFEYNGFKFFDNQGMKFDLLSTLTLERYSQILDKFEPVLPNQIGRCQNKSELAEKYVEYLRKNIPNTNLKICFDCANGVTSLIAKKIFPNAYFTGTMVHCDKENLECGATCPENMAKFVREKNADIGFSLDGDGDRLITVLKDGTILDGDDILFALSKHLLGKNELAKKQVVGTILTNYGTELALNKIGVKLIRQNVGDKFVCAEMKKKKLVLGAEQSGHIIIANDCLIGDGIFTAIKIISLINEVGDLKNYISEVQKFSQINDNVEISEEMRDYVLNNCEFKNFIEYCENELGIKGRLVVRKSGTENLIRILVEGQDINELRLITKAIKEKILELAK